MKKMIFFLVVMFFVSVFMVVYSLCFPTKARGEDAAADYQMQAAIYLCDDNAELTETLDDLVGINVISFGSEVIITPTSHFFLLIKKMILAEERQKDYKEILFKLYKENIRLKQALKQRTFKAERIR